MAEPPPGPEELRDLLALWLARGVGPVRLQRLLERFETPAAVRAASSPELTRVRSISAKTAAAILDRDGLDRAVDDELAAIEKSGAHVVVRGGPGYPPLLEPLPDAPPLLVVRGRLELAAAEPLHDLTPLAVVGSRRATHYGLDQTARFGGGVARSGHTIVSGGARGIDRAAHEAALKCGGRTIAVLGCGLGRVYPPEHAELYDAIAAQGAVVSELPMNTAPAAENFPSRNRIISGLSLAVLVVEAGLRSGALITARVAVEEQGRDAMAIPGRVDDAASAGTLELIKRGGGALVTEPAEAVTTIREIARTWGVPVAGAHMSSPHTTANPTQELQDAPSPSNAEACAAHQPILVAMGRGASFDELLDRLDISASRLRSELALLEIDGLIERSGDILRPRTGEMPQKK